MYKIIEIIQSDKGSKLYSWAPEKKISLLKRTANHDKAIGDKARHGIMTVDPPINPMDIKEARSITTLLINKYVDELMEK